MADPTTTTSSGTLTPTSPITSSTRLPTSPSPCSTPCAPRPHRQLVSPQTADDRAVIAQHLHVLRGVALLLHRHRALVHQGLHRRARTPIMHNVQRFYPRRPVVLGGHHARGYSYATPLMRPRACVSSRSRTLVVVSTTGSYKKCHYVRMSERKLCYVTIWSLTEPRINPIVCGLLWTLGCRNTRCRSLRFGHMSGLPPHQVTQMTTTLSISSGGIAFRHGRAQEGGRGLRAMLDRRRRSREVSVAGLCRCLDAVAWWVATRQHGSAATIIPSMYPRARFHSHLCQSSSLLYLLGRLLLRLLSSARCSPSPGIPVSDCTCTFSWVCPRFWCKSNDVGCSLTKSRVTNKKQRSMWYMTWCAFVSMMC